MSLADINFMPLKYFMNQETAISSHEGISYSAKEGSIGTLYLCGPIRTLGPFIYYMHSAVCGCGNHPTPKRWKIVSGKV